MRSNFISVYFDSSIKRNKNLSIMNNKATKTYSNLSSAKRALKRIFGAGVFGSNFTHANARFVNGYIDTETNTLTLSSTYFVETSLERAFKIGVDNI